jgi:hypothetical protein
MDVWPRLNRVSDDFRSQRSEYDQSRGRTNAQQLKDIVSSRHRLEVTGQLIFSPPPGVRNVDSRVLTSPPQLTKAP